MSEHNLRLDDEAAQWLYENFATAVLQHIPLNMVIELAECPVLCCTLAGMIIANKDFPFPDDICECAERTQEYFAGAREAHVLIEAGWTVKSWATLERLRRKDKVLIPNEITLREMTNAAAVEIILKVDADELISRTGDALKPHWRILRNAARHS